jgi:hypothetical protein
VPKRIMHGLALTLCALVALGASVTVMSQLGRQEPLVLPLLHDPSSPQIGRGETFLLTHRNYPPWDATDLVPTDLVLVVFLAGVLVAFGFVAYFAKRNWRKALLPLVAFSVLTVGMSGWVMTSLDRCRWYLTHCQVPCAPGQESRTASAGHTEIDCK